MSKFGRKQREAPEGFEVVEPTLTALDNELRERVNDPHEGLRKTESQWPVHQINWQRSRYIYDMYYTYGRISREVYDFCIKNKLVDAALIAKWKKPGYERLCSTYAINPRNYKFGTVSICRVPKQCLAVGTQIEDPTTGCRGCASGPGGEKNIFGNKYGQYLAAIQIAREEKQRLREQREHDNDDNEDFGEERIDPTEGKGTFHDTIDEGSVVGAQDGSSGNKASVWAADGEHVSIPSDFYGVLAPDAEREGSMAMKQLRGRDIGKNDSYDGPASKRSRDK